jgi:pimeloyl-ACP methyl ester carboxylesterase
MHGFGILANRFLPHHMTKVAAQFSQHGFEVLFPQVSPYNSTSVRFEQWKAHLLREGKPVHLVAHSQGGREALLLAADPETIPCIKSVHLVATPLKSGSAAFLLNLFPSFIRKRLFDFLEGHAQRLFPGLPNDLEASAKSLFAPMTEVIIPAHIPVFSYICRVPAFSFNRLPYFLWFTHLYLHFREGANDGLVSTQSQYFGTEKGPFKLHHGAQLGLVRGKEGRRAFEELWGSVILEIDRSETL